MQDLEIDKHLSTLVAEAFDTSFEMPCGTDWNEREANARRVLVGSSVCGAERLIENVYLGGDTIRPYLAVQVLDQLHLASFEQVRVLSQPPLLAQLDGGTYGAISRTKSSQGFTMRRVKNHPTLVGKLSTPSVYLISLANASRYRLRRYPLNISRLAQWLRFQHAARVRLADLALNFGDDLDALGRDVVSNKPDILAVSVNFGELDSLRRLISFVRNSRLRPFICLGNVLAAWAVDEIKDACRGFEYFISRSYGEHDIESVCRGIKQDCAGEATLALRGSRDGLSPTVLVMPDETLLVQTLRQGGQASVEISFGCQYGHCTFCPRDHRGKGWSRPESADATAVIQRMTSVISQNAGRNSAVLSIVDEDAFGQEGRDLKDGEPSIVSNVTRAGLQNVRCEVYTRLEQVFDRRWERGASVRRLGQLITMRRYLARVFVGVESGSNSQLRRYGKGQTTEDIVAALRAGALVKLPLEFGFITFDPLLTQQELSESLEFLARRDVLLTTDQNLTADRIYTLVTGELATETNAGPPVFSRVAYMATELELFVNSPFVKLLRDAAPELLGNYDSAFARFNYSYRDSSIAQVAGWCRVWTEGTFVPIYKLRLAARIAHADDCHRNDVVERYRTATFALLTSLTRRFCVSIADRATDLLSQCEPELMLVLSRGDALPDLDALWHWVQAGAANLPSTESVRFNNESRFIRRAA